MNKTTLEILEDAFLSLSQMTNQEAKQETIDKGIVIPNQPLLSNLIDSFIFDFKGCFNEIINSDKNIWFDIESIKRKNVNIDNKKSHQSVALSF